MELIDQHTKTIMEGCKERARDAGLRFDDETLEYIVTNRDLLELSPKVMIPTLYDYWVHDVEVLQGEGELRALPHNPYETVINTRPAISFYNDNNPDWLNVMIFYHVLAHIDFFQNNLFFRHTWEYDFTGQALSDKRLIAQLRSEKGRWVDYVIEFARGIDNLVGYLRRARAATTGPPATHRDRRLDYYFDVFLQSVKKVHDQRVHQGDRALQRQPAAATASSASDNFFAEVDQRNIPSSRRSSASTATTKPSRRRGPAPVPHGALAVPEPGREQVDEVGHRGRPQDLHLFPAADPDQDHERGLGELLAREAVPARTTGSAATRSTSPGSTPG